MASVTLNRPGPNLGATLGDSPALARRTVSYDDVREGRMSSCHPHIVERASRKHPRRLKIRDAATVIKIGSPTTRLTATRRMRQSFHRRLCIEIDAIHYVSKLGCERVADVIGGIQRAIYDWIALTLSALATREPSAQVDPSSTSAAVRGKFIVQSFGGMGIVERWRRCARLDWAPSVSYGASTVYVRHVLFTHATATSVPPSTVR